MKKLLWLIVVVVVGAVGWFLASPLFIDRVVDEPLPSVSSVAQGTEPMTLKDMMSLPPAAREQQRDAIMEAAAAMPDVAVDETMADALSADLSEDAGKVLAQEQVVVNAVAPALVASGSFRDADPVHQGSGSAKLIRLPGGSHLVRFEDFRASNGPDLVVYLAKHANPQSAADVTDGGYVSLGKLKGNVGNQNYPLPVELDPTEYQSVVIWCELFGVLFSPAPLSRGV